MATSRSKPGIEFHVWTLGDEPGQNEKDPRDASARIEKAWGRKTKKRGTTLLLGTAIT
jgi:hypothetical protein